MKKLLTTAYALSLSGLALAQQQQVGAFQTVAVTSQIAPGAAAGANGGTGSMLLNVVNSFKQISTTLYSSLFVVALILFFFGIFKYMAKGGDGKSHSDGIKYMGFGILALFVMVGIWGIISFMSANLGIGVGGDIPTPGVPSSVRTY